MSGTTDPSWQSKEKAEEANYAHQKEREQLEAIQRVLDEEEAQKLLNLCLDEEETQNKTEPVLDRDFEGGYGGQEDLEDRYASTLGMH